MVVKGSTNDAHQAATMRSNRCATMKAVADVRLNRVLSYPGTTCWNWVALTWSLLDINSHFRCRIRNVHVSPVVDHMLLQARRHSERNVRRTRKPNRCTGHRHSVLTGAGQPGRHSTGASRSVSAAGKDSIFASSASAATTTIGAPFGADVRVRVVVDRASERSRRNRSSRLRCDRPDGRRFALLD